MKLMMKTQSITKMIYPTDGHTWLRRLTFFTRGLTRGFSRQSKNQSKLTRDLWSHLIPDNTKYTLTLPSPLRSVYNISIKKLIK